MPTINDSMGTRFEDIVQENFPGFTRHNTLGALPDFFGNGFWLEAKVGNIVFGTRLKEYQIVSFSGLEEPVVYAIGFHDFDNAGKRLVQKTDEGRQRLLEREMNLVGVYFVTSEVINGIWAGESRVSKKGGLVYGLCKRRFLERVIDGASFVREGRRLTAEEYYGINRDELALQAPISAGLQFSVGWILNERTDEPVIDYLIKIGIIK
jgi:hypothetical protein